MASGEECRYARQQGACSRGTSWEEEKGGYADDEGVQARARGAEKMPEVLLREAVLCGRGGCLVGEVEQWI